MAGNSRPPTHRRPYGGGLGGNLDAGPFIMQLGGIQAIQNQKAMQGGEARRILAENGGQGARGVEFQELDAFIPMPGPMVLP